MSDDELNEYDLSAWGAPPAPTGLADGVLARMTATDEAIAVAMQRRGTRRWWIAGGIAAGAVVASLGLWLVLHTPNAGSSTGALVAHKPQHVELGATSANVDAGADLKWWRTGSTLHVEQHRGASTWLVGGDDHLVIDAGARAGSGAMNATVDATGASLRVEVSMNMTDVRVIGASAATAAAVAMVTVIVYEGHVKATSGGQTMVVVPGTTVEARAGQPPREPANIGASMPLPLPTEPGVDLALPVGESATIHDPRGSTTIQFLSRCKDHTDVQIEPPNVKVSRPNTTSISSALTLPAGEYHYAIRCDGNTEPSARGEVIIMTDAGTAALAPDGDGSEVIRIGSIDLPIDGAAWPDPVHVVGDTISNATVSIAGRAVLVDSAAHFAGDLADHPTTIAIRISDDKRGVHYYIRRSGTGKDVTVATHTDPLPANQCDEAACVLDNYTGPCCFNFRKNDAPDRASVDKVIAAEQATIDTCAADQGGNVKIKLKIRTDGFVGSTTVVTASDPQLGVCVAAALHRLAFEPSKHGGTFTFPFSFPAKAKTQTKCDPQPLIEAGVNDEARGAHAQALKQFDDAFRCKPDDVHTIGLAFMAACNAANVVKARIYWAKMSPDGRNQRLQMCVRNHITADMLDGGIGKLDIVAKQPAQVFIDGRNTTMVTPLVDWELSPGVHKVVLTAKGKSWSYTVTVEAGKTTKLTADDR